MTAREAWRRIAGFPGYEVSDRGRVRSLDRTVSCIRGGVKRTVFWRGRVLRATTGSHGYRQVSLPAGVEACVHHLVAEAFIGPRPPGLNVLHADGDRQNCRADNLYYGDQADNGSDAKRHGTTPAGEKNGQEKLSIEDVRLIRKAPGLQADIAARFDCSPSNISSIKRGASWAGVE